MHAALCEPSRFIVNGDMETTWFLRNLIVMYCRACSSLFNQTIHMTVLVMDDVGGSRLYIFSKIAELR